MTEPKLNILEIDTKIKNNFKFERDNLQSYKNHLSELLVTQQENIPIRVKNDLERNISKLRKKITDIENRDTENFYLIETTPFIEKYKTILSTPMQISFMGRKRKTNYEKQSIIDKYLNIVQKYYKVDIDYKEKKGKMYCKECKNKKDFEIVDETVYVCQICGIENEVLPQTISYRDIDRVNISTKYSYDRKVHFRDCINQYQGKQNSTIDQKVYDQLEEQFKLHHLLVGDSETPKEERFSRITKEHIAMFLKELGYSKHYENINLIHYNLTGNKPDDISHLEEKLLIDFDILVELYDKRFKYKTDRTSFINTQYVLFQLLQRYKHPCKKEDFVMLKTIDRQAFHDDVCGVLFRELGWNLVPMY